MKTLYIFVEGSDDERFFKWYFYNVNKVIVQYAKEKQEKINEYLKSVDKISYADYIFTGDVDDKTIDDKKESIIRHFPSCAKNKIILVKKEIEGWYVAGLNSDDCHKFKLKYLYNTDNLAKEQFDAMKPKKYNRIDFMIEILKCFDCCEAKARNTTFSYFATRLNR